VALQEVRWVESGSHPAENYTFLYGNANHHLGTVFFIWIEFIKDRMFHIKLRGHLCDIFVLNVRAPTKDKSDDTKDSFYSE
jgi:hypothetical protein